MSFDDMDLADLLAAMGHGAKGRSQHTMPTKGHDYESAVTISLEDAKRGCTVSLNLADASGERTLQVTIPPGASQDQKLRLRGKGGKGHHGGPDGDIYLHINLAAHAVFRPDQHDLYFDLTLSPWEAALGTEIEVPTLEGNVLLTVPPGTRTGRKLRLRGRGLTAGHSDLYAMVRIDIPPSLSARERELFQELARVSTYRPRT
jgi:curved DNA-binding protein